MNDRILYLEQQIAAKFLHKNIDILCFDQVDSVMDLAKQLKPVEKTLILSRKQRQGRGQHGREWVSADGALLCCLCFTVDNSKLANLSAFSLVVAIQVAELLNSFGMKAGCKWPNDILLADSFKKICGILLEVSAAENSSKSLLRIGIGLNIKDSPDYASSVQNELGFEISLPEIAASLTERCLDAFDNFTEKGFLFYKDKWNELDLMLNRKIDFTDGELKVCGISLGADESGRYSVQTETGLRTFVSGRIVYSVSR